MSFNSIVRDIKNLKVQGAQNVAKASLEALMLFAKQNHKKKDFHVKIQDAKDILFHTRPTEPLMRNVLNFATNELDREANLLAGLIERQKWLNERFDKAERKIAIYGAKKVFDGSAVFTHCHSSSVISAFIEAKKLKRSFTVLNTETRPLFQGRKTALDLSKAGIKVTHFVDSSARVALKHADVMFIGADAISSEGKVTNKIGSEMFAEIASRYDVPLYVCTDSWKFNPLSVFGEEEIIEERASAEVWEKPPKGVTVSNLAFEKVKPDLITGIISELGVFKPEVFVREVKERYPFLINASS